MNQSAPQTQLSPRRWLSGAVAAAMIAGCGGQAQPPTTQPPAPQIVQPPAPTTQEPTVRPPAQSTSGTQLTQDYMPFTAGRSWSYQVTSSLGNQQETGNVTWTVNEAGDDVTSVTIDSDAGGQKQTVTNKVVKNSDGTVTITTTTNGQTQSQTVKPEDAANLTGGPQGANGSSAQQPRGTPDTVTVGAGTFDALKVINQLPENQGTVTAWYAKDVGLVKQEIQAQTQQGNVRSTMELVAYK